MEKSLIIKIASNETLSVLQKLEIIQGNLSDEEAVEQLENVLFRAFFDLEDGLRRIIKSMLDILLDRVFQEVKIKSIIEQLAAEEAKKQVEFEKNMTVKDVVFAYKIIDEREIKDGFTDSEIKERLCQFDGQQNNGHDYSTEYAFRCIKAAQKQSGHHS